MLFGGSWGKREGIGGLRQGLSLSAEGGRKTPPKAGENRADQDSNSNGDEKGRNGPREKYPKLALRKDHRLAECIL